MIRLSFVALFLVSFAVVDAQKKSEGLDYKFQPTTNYPFYFAFTEKQGDRFHREIYFASTGSMAKDEWYSDEDLRERVGEVKQFHSNKYLKSRGNYVDGKRSGPWLSFHKNGVMSDSANYTAGKLNGIRLGWDSEGFLVDSSSFDGKGNGIQFTWYPGGTISSKGRWINDTLRNGLWVYYHQNGEVKANVTYAGDQATIACFDDKGIALPNADCVEREAEFPGEISGWIKFLTKTLNPKVPVNEKAPAGVYTVYALFIVTKDGELKDIEALTNIGYGMEKEVIRVLKKSPKWIPARQYGKFVNAYHIQPVSFQVVDE